jgi:hypothetical protein
MGTFVGMLIRVLLLGMFVKLMLKWERPFLWAFLYTLALVPVTLLHDPPMSRFLITTGAMLVITSLYMWLLSDILEEGSELWWLVLVAGIIASMLPSLL